MLMTRKILKNVPDHFFGPRGPFYPFGPGPTAFKLIFFDFNQKWDSGPKFYADNEKNTEKNPGLFVLDPRVHFIQSVRVPQNLILIFFDFIQKLNSGPKFYVDDEKNIKQNPWPLFWPQWSFFLFGSGPKIIKKHFFGYQQKVRF